MVYAALLRGINVGGKNKVEMARLKNVFEKAGFSDVKTYINSGNIIFSDDNRTKNEITKILEYSIENEFDLKINVLVRDIHNINEIASSLPDTWVNDKKTKCGVMFLWEGYQEPNVLEQLKIKPGIDTVKYVGGAIVWHVDRKNVTKSGMMKIVGTELYKKMTVRNCNTVRKVAALMNGV